MPDPIWSQLLLQIILILINAFFACAEIAIISLNENKLKKQADDGDKKAVRMLKITEKPERFLSTIQICITLAGFMASAFAADNFSGKLSNWLVNDLNIVFISEATIQSISVILITLVLAFFTLVFGELVPKRIAMKKTEKIAYAASAVVGFFSSVFKPIVWLLSKSTNGVLRLLGINPDEEDEEVTEEEIMLMVDMGEESGTIEKTEKELIENVFEFNNITASDIMVHRTEIAALDVIDTDDEVLKLIEESGFSRLPVYEDDIDHIIGILNVKKYMLEKSMGKNISLRESLLPAYFVPRTVRADVLFRDMQKKKVHIAIVLDEYGGTSGLITMEDLLEEIVGNIYDESDKHDEASDIIKISDDTWNVEGTVELERLVNEIGLVYDEDETEIDTLSGLVFSQLSEIPESEAQIPEIDVYNLHIKVTSVVDRHVDWALVKVLPRPEEAIEDD